MSVRVVARIRPLLKQELEKDSIIDAASSPADLDGRPSVVRIPNPRNASESYSFQFNSVYSQEATQQDLFDNEVAPTVKHLFSGFDITLFAYGVTGTGKTHTMRGGKALADRGVIPRLLSSIYRRGRKIEKDSDGRNKVEVSMSYYEIYNDKVYDLFEPPEKRTPSGLPIRDNNGKTVVAGLTERPCTTLKEFEHLYDQANINRSTSATKLNAHSSRSHAILCVKVAQISENQTVISTASAIDLAGSEDNRRTGNVNQALVESSSINKSLFVLAQCVEAISKKQARIPYRESKMTRILSLGQNNGLTIMILNLAPVRSYHLDTLSSLNFANRTKKIEVREVENEPIFKGPPRQASHITGGSFQRQPLRPLSTLTNLDLRVNPDPKDKPVKAFAVYAEKGRPTIVTSSSASAHKESLKRSSEALQPVRPDKTIRTSDYKSAKPTQPEISRADIEDLINRTIEDKLASRALADVAKANTPALSEEIQKRLEALEQRIEIKEDGRAQGLQFLLMAKQHAAHGEDTSALRMYQLALPFFPDNEKLAHKMAALRERIRQKREEGEPKVSIAAAVPVVASAANDTTVRILEAGSPDDDYHEDPSAQEEEEDDDEYTERDGFHFRVKASRKAKTQVFSDEAPEEAETPRTRRLLNILNSRDVAQIKSLKGMGTKKADALIRFMSAHDEDVDKPMAVRGLRELRALRGIGTKTVEAMRMGIVV